MSTDLRYRPAAPPEVAIRMVALGDRQEDNLGQMPSQGGEHRDLDVLTPLSAFFKEGLPHPLMIVPVIWKHGSNKDASTWSRLFSFISVVCLFVSFLVHLAALTSWQWIKKETVQCNLAYLSVFLRIVAATCLLLFLDPVRHRVAILPLLFLVLVLLAYFRKTSIISRSREARSEWVIHDGTERPHRDGNRSLKVGPELKHWFDLSSKVVTIAYGGLLGTVFGYAKEGSTSNEQLLSGNRGYMATDCFLSYSILLGLLVQLFSTVPSYIQNSEVRGRMIKLYLRIVAYASLMFLILAAVMAAEEILREQVFIACFVQIVVIPVLCFCYEIFHGPSGYWYQNQSAEDGLPETISRREEDDMFAQYVLAYVTFTFAALMASNSKYGTKRGGMGVSLSMWFKFSMLSVLHGVLSYAVRQLVFSEAPNMRSSALPKRLWTWSMFATLPFTVVLVACVTHMYSEEIKNIF